MHDLRSYTLDTYDGPRFIARTAVASRNPLSALREAGYADLHQFQNIKLSSRRLFAEFVGSTKCLVIEAIP